MTLWPHQQVAIDRAQDAIARGLPSGLVPAPLKIGGCQRWREDEISLWLKCGAPVRSEWELKRDVELAPPVENK